MCFRAGTALQQQFPQRAGQRVVTTRSRRGRAELLEHDLKLVPAPSKGSGWLTNLAGMDWHAAALVVGLWDCCRSTALHLSLRADRDAALPMPEVQSSTTMLICIFSKQTPYPGATALHALFIAPMHEF